jgi:Tfp pilus assembly protein PilZ
VKELFLCYGSFEAFTADYETNLRKGRAFVAGADGVALGDRCALGIEHPATGARIQMLADAVWIGPEGVGLAFVDRDAAAKARLEGLAAPPDEEAAPPEQDAEPGEAAAKDGPFAGARAEGRAKTPRNLHERVRMLSIGQREDLARHGALTERVALERAYGGVVWEGLLQNAAISTAEVARIARNGTLPKPLVHVIVNNAGWVSSPEVQRALMTNPRCTGAHLERVVRAIPSNELKRMAQNCPYRGEVRNLVRQFAGRK